MIAFNDYYVQQDNEFWEWVQQATDQELIDNVNEYKKSEHYKDNYGTTTHRRDS